MNYGFSTHDQLPAHIILTDKLSTHTTKAQYANIITDPIS